MGVAPSCILSFPPALTGRWVAGAALHSTSGPVPRDQPRAAMWQPTPAAFGLVTLEKQARKS